MATPETALETTGPTERNPWKEQQAAQLWQMIGATKLASQLSAVLTSQTLQALQRVRDEKLWAHAGCESFRDFLDSHPGSPMSYDQFNRREKLLEAEGPEAFDLMNSVNAPQRVRQLLKGHIEVDGDEIRIGDERVRRDDSEAILTLLTRQEAKLLEQQRTIDRGKKDVEKHKARVIEAEKRAVVANPTGTPTGQALLTAAGALTQLREALEVASDEEKAGLSEQIFELMRVQSLELSAALGIATKAEVKAAKSGDDLGVSDEELAELGES